MSLNHNSDTISDNSGISFESFFRKHDAIFLLMNGQTGQLIDANDAALHFYGYSTQQIKSMKIEDIIKLSPDELDAERQRAVKEERKYFIVPHLLANGEIRIVEVHTTPIILSNKTYLFSVIHDITERKQAEEELERHRKHLEDMVDERTVELEAQNITLQELNTTLKVLLKQRENDKKDMEERFVMNIRNLVLPFVEQMKKGRLDVGQRLNLDIIETHLHDIATPLLKNIRQFNFTPKEIKVAVLVKEGKSTKEIAKILGIAAGSIDIHRKNIRKKLGLSNRRANLQSYLEAIEQ